MYSSVHEKVHSKGMGMDAIFLYCLCHVIGLRCVLTGTADPVASNGPVTKEIYSI